MASDVTKPSRRLFISSLLIHSFHETEEDGPERLYSEDCQ